MVLDNSVSQRMTVNNYKPPRGVLARPYLVHRDCDRARALHGEAFCIGGPDMTKTSASETCSPVFDCLDSLDSLLSSAAQADLNGLWYDVLDADTDEFLPSPALAPILAGLTELKAEIVAEFDKTEAALRALATTIGVDLT